ncbi:hypothetical protein N7G274_006700 [Stereocaulon virgatum]|uniref:Thaumatin-like protein n=1 Tax=Stereocaulon virgatum TaxID=373712 RepID=A0ABR4A5U2_9LECA
MKPGYHVTALLLALAVPGQMAAVTVTTIIPVSVWISNGAEIPYIPNPTPKPAPAPAPVPAAAPGPGQGLPVERLVQQSPPPASTALPSPTVPSASGPAGTPAHVPQDQLAQESAQGQTLPTATQAPTAITPAPQPPAGLGQGVMTIVIQNNWPTPLSISYLDNAGSPGPIGNPQEAPLGTSTTVVYPTGWAGRIYVGKTINAADSKIEGSTTGANDIDVSYVDGYSVPITCSAKGKAVTGCNIDLWSVSGACADSVGEKDVCLNPMQGVADGPSIPWFLPCQGAAYTFPNDNIANNGDTGTPEITCCIGTADQGCKDAPERQGKSKNVASKKKRSLAQVLGGRAPNAPSLLPHAHSHLKRHAHKARAHGHRLVRDFKDVV